MDSRKRQRAVPVTGILLALLALGAIAQGLLPVPALTARVIDQTGTLSKDQISKLEGRLAAFEAERGAQIVVLLVPTTKPEDIAAYANRVASTWKIGRREVGDGLLVVVAKNDRTVRIEVARALEGAVPDAAARQIIDQRIVPAFREGDFHAGLDRGLDVLMARIRGEALPAPSRSAELPDHESEHVTGLLGAVIFFAGLIAVIALALLTSIALAGAEASRRHGLPLAIVLSVLLAVVPTAGMLLVSFSWIVVVVMVVSAAYTITALLLLRRSVRPRILRSFVLYRGPGDAACSSDGGSSSSDTGWSSSDSGGFSSGGGGSFGGGGASGRW